MTASKPGIVTLALVWDTFREAFARKIFWGFFGCSTAQRPSYDLELAVKRLDITDLPRCASGPVTPNARFKVQEESRPWTERHPALLWTGLCAGVLLLGLILLRTLREMKA